MLPEKIDSLADDVKSVVLELLRQNSGLTARVDELVAQNKAHRAASLNGFFDSIDFVNTDVVHEHNVAPRQRRSEKLFRIGLKRLAGHRSFEHEGRGDAIVA